MDKNLEMLFASRTLWGTIESLFSLRRLTAVGIQLLLVWSLSPLGGQATLRALQRSVAVTRNQTELRYLYTGPYAAYLVPNVSVVERPVDVDIFLSELGAPFFRKISARDAWGNVRVPRLEMLPALSEGNSSSHQQWLPVEGISQPEHFSSLTGIPIVGLPGSTASLTTDFTIEVSYMSLDCSAWDTFPESDPCLAHYKHIGNNLNRFCPKSGDLDRVWLTQNTTWFLDASVPSAEWNNASVIAQDPRTRVLHFVSSYPNGNVSEKSLSATNCSVTETHVEVAISCHTGHLCRATNMRRSLVDKRPESGTPLDSVKRRQHMVASMPTLLVLNGTRQGDIEYFLGDSKKPVLAVLESAFPYDLSKVPTPLFSSRLMLLINSWYQIDLLRSSRVILGHFPANLSAYGFNFADTPADGKVDSTVVDNSCRHLCTQSTLATLTHAVEVYSYNQFWLILLISSSIVLLAIGLAGTVLGRYTHLPDMIGYVASMTYNNRHFELPGRKGGVLDAMCRTRILQDLPVAAGDVSGSEEVGKIAFTTGAIVHMLEKRRKYM
jgi:hypothetical protein